MKPILLAALLSSLVIAGATDAEAQARHERVQISEMKSGGKVVGARIKLTLRSESQNWKDVLIGIGPSSGIQNSSNITTYRKLASDKSAGHLLHQFPAIANPAQTQEVTLEVKYADVPQLKPGEPIQIISAWRPPSGDSVHAWGLTRYGVTETTYKLPGKANAQQQQLARRSGKRAATKTSKRAPTKTRQRAPTKTRQRAVTVTKQSAPTKTRAPARSSRTIDPRFASSKPPRSAKHAALRARGQARPKAAVKRKARPLRAKKAR